LQEEGDSRVVAKLPIIHTYRVTSEEVIGQSLRELHREKGYTWAVLRIRRGDDLIEPDGDTVAKMDDIVALVGDVEELHRQGW
jgi:Trk K+ transport system NAD-binding subunit